MNRFTGNMPLRIVGNDGYLYYQFAKRVIDLGFAKTVRLNKEKFKARLLHSKTETSMLLIGVNFIIESMMLFMNFLFQNFVILIKWITLRYNKVRLRAVVF